MVDFEIWFALLYSRNTYVVIRLKYIAGDLQDKGLGYSC